MKPEAERELEQELERWRHQLITWLGFIFLCATFLVFAILVTYFEMRFWYAIGAAILIAWIGVGIGGRAIFKKHAVRRYLGEMTNEKSNGPG
jgi:purine-cytosine permease-like protein